MILAIIAKSLLAGSLIVPVAVDRVVSWPLPERGTAMPLAEKAAAIGPLVSLATECIARTVAADSRLAGVTGAAEFNDLIVQSVPSCTDDLRAMIDVYNRVYGEGAGETFFSGPYLDGLPAEVTSLVRRGPT